MKNILLSIASCFICLISSAQITTNTQWTWMKGDTLLPQYGVYGVQGIAASTNKPGAREDQVSWKDVSGNVWMFGGNGFSSTGASAGSLNDLWKYNTSTNQWTWISGDNTINNTGVYGTKGTAAASNKPGARSGSITWTDASGNFWLFGGSGFATATTGSLNDLWKYNPTTNQWTWMSGDNVTNSTGIYGAQGTADPANKPGARYQSISWTDASGNFWLFGGGGYAESGGLGKLNDLWKYNPITNQWTWMKGDNTINVSGVYGTQGTGDPLNKPGGREQSVSWLDAVGNFWLYGGGGYPESGALGTLNDLWKYDLSANQWTFMKGDKTINTVYGGNFGVYGTKGTAAAENKPGAGYGGTTWTDASGNLWLLGGFGFTNFLNPDYGVINDLFKYDPVNNQWTWVKGDNVIGKAGVYGTQGVPAAVNKPGARLQTISWIDNSGNLWMCGGNGYPIISGSYTVNLNDIWKYDPSANQWTWIKGDIDFNFTGLYGTQGVANAVNKPGARDGSAAWTDASGNFWLFGGKGSAAYGVGQLNDLWKYNPTANQWAWMKGDTIGNVVGIYGSLGTASITNKPGARYGSVSWKDGTGNLWLFGGFNNNIGGFNDLWKYDPSTNQWTWVAGDNTINVLGVYGTLGTAAAGNKPGARQGAVSWIDASGNMWLFGGYFFDISNYTYNNLNDLWKFDPNTNLWTWVSGDNTPNSTGVYGTQGTTAPDNKPPARDAAVGWIDDSGNFWLFGGEQQFPFGGNLNDLWKYNPITNQWTWMKGDNFIDGNPVYGGISPGTTSDFTKPGSRFGSIAWTDNFSNFWLFGGHGKAYSTTNDLNDLWKYNLSTNQWTWIKGDRNCCSFSNYGLQGSLSDFAMPGARSESVAWKDLGNNLWLFGGAGFGTNAINYTGDLNDLFRIGNNSLLPLTLMSISAELVEKRVIVKWQTAQEINTDHFMVERSIDARNFTTLGSVAASGNSSSVISYSYNDRQPFRGTNYYRLKMVDKDGKFKYSNVAIINIPTDNTVSIYPNPASNFIQIGGVQAITTIQIFNIAGKLIKQFKPIPGNSYGISDLSKGIYMVRIISNRGETILKIEKQ